MEHLCVRCNKNLKKPIEQNAIYVYKIVEPIKDIRPELLCKKCYNKETDTIIWGFLDNL
jgi:hypothetical protein